MMVTLLFIGVLTLAFNVQTVKASGTIYVRADGSVDPPTAPISSVDNVTYTFTGNIYDSIVVERDNIVVDGAGYTVQGTGITLLERSNVTIKNMEIKAFDYGIWLNASSSNSIHGNNITANKHDGICLLWYSSNNSISGNNITNNGYGIGVLWYSDYNSISGNNITNNGYGIGVSWHSNSNSISGNNITNNEDGIVLASSIGNSISGNNITNNEHGIVLGISIGNSISGNNITNNGYGIYLGGSYNTIHGNDIIDNNHGVYTTTAFNNKFYHNNFINNTNQTFQFSTETTNTWDVGGEGNYWSDYKGVDYTGDGIGDTPYVINENNRDNHPLMKPWTPTWHPIPFWMQWWFWTIIAAGIAVAIGTVYLLKKRKPPTPTAPTPPTEGTETSIE